MTVSAHRSAVCRLLAARSRRARLAVLPLAFLAAGCGEEPSPELNLPDWLVEAQQQAEADEAAATLPSRDMPRELAAPATSLPLAMTERDEGTNLAASPPDGLRLVAGERFPLVRTIETALTQSLPDGTTEDYVSRVRVSFTLSVLAVEADRSRIGVVFDRFELARTTGGATTTGDTLVASSGDAPELQAVSTLVGRGFDYWIDRDNQLLTIEGKDALLADAVEQLGPEMRGRVLAAFGATTELSTLLDASIGLPAERLRSGEQWQVAATAPATMTRTYAITGATAESAVLTVDGSMNPALLPSENGLQAEILGGSLRGDCRIDRRTGLPLSAQSVELVEMAVQLPDGSRLAQQRRTSSTLEPQQPSDLASAGRAAPPVSQAGGFPPEPLSDQSGSIRQTGGTAGDTLGGLSETLQPTTGGIVQPEPYFRR